MEYVLVNVSQENLELPKFEKIKKRTIKKFYFTAILIITFFGVRLLDIISTVICLKSFPFCRESNQLAVDIVEKPFLWTMINVIITGILLVINFALWFINKKNDMVDYIAIGYGIMVLIVILVCLWPVLNNFNIIFKYKDLI